MDQIGVRRAPRGAGMTYINPLANSVLQGTQTQQQMSVDKTRQIRREQAAAKDSTTRSDQLEHQVESPEALTEIHDDGNRKPASRNKHQKRQGASAECRDDAGGENHIDLTA